jgi:eukaryotic-like serine/threonine-protein kinase
MVSERPSVRSDIEALLGSTQYRPLALLGRGSMGEVWAVRHDFIGRDFALKVLHRHHLDNHQLIERLRFEAKAIAALEHPNIVEVTDFWCAGDGRPCLVMELLAGRRLDRVLLQRRQLPGPEVVELGRQALSALIAAHAMGLVHRDIKPENLFLHLGEAPPWTLKLLDFGLARVNSGMAPGASLRPLDLTRTGTLLGSPRFMSPEALRGERVEQDGDIYSLGVVMYLCLVGMHSHFDFATSPAFYPPSQSGAIDCSAELDAVVLRAVEIDRGRRYPTAAAFLADLDAIACLPIVTDALATKGPNS